MNLTGWRGGMTMAEKRGGPSLATIAFVLFLLIGPTALPATGWAADPQLDAIYKQTLAEIPGLPKAILEGALKEGKLTIYHLVNKEAVQEMIREFRHRFPIEIDTFMASGGPLSLKFTSEVRAGRAIADIWWHTAPWEADLVAREGLLANYVITSDAAYPDSLKSKGWWYPMSHQLIGTAWNSDLVPDKDAEVLKTWEGILDPRWAGKGAMVNIVAGGSAHLPYYFFDKGKGPEFWKKLAAQRPAIFPGIMPESERLAAGEFSVLLHALEVGPFTQWQKGAPVRWYFPEPALTMPYTQAISKIAPHPNAARLWQEWVMSVQGQTLWSKYSGSPPARPGVPDLREVARQPWYRMPKAFYQYRREDIPKELPRLKELFDRSFK